MRVCVCACVRVCVLTCVRVCKRQQLFLILGKKLFRSHALQPHSPSQGIDKISQCSDNYKQPHDMQSINHPLWCRSCSMSCTNSHSSFTDQQMIKTSLMHVIAQVIGKQGFVILNAHLFVKRGNADNLLYDCILKLPSYYCNWNTWKYCVVWC